MAKTWQNVANLLEYFGFQSQSYYHSVPDINYDPDDPLAYYLDMRPRARYSGPSDESGRPLMTCAGRTLIFPTHLIMYGLGHLEEYRRNHRTESLTRFRSCSDWLVENQAEDGSWLIRLPSKAFGLDRPFRSAMVQGLAVSALVRAFVCFDQDRFAAAAVRALQPFHKLTSSDGVATTHPEGSFYEEYPCQPARHVLNGFLYALWGLHDLVRLRQNDEAGALWQAGLSTLIHWLPKYDIGHWSLYQLPADPRNPATVPYHRLHINQLGVMHAITSEPIFKEYHDKWQGYLENRLNAIRTLPAKLRWLAGNK